MFKNVNCDFNVSLNLEISFDNEEDNKSVTLIEGDTIKIKYLNLDKSLVECIGKIKNIKHSLIQSHLQYISDKHEIYIELDCSKEYESNTLRLEVSNIRNIEKILPEIITNSDINENYSNLTNTEV